MYRGLPKAIKMGVVFIKWAWLENFLAHYCYNPTILKFLDLPLILPLWSQYIRDLTPKEEGEKNSSFLDDFVDTRESPFVRPVHCV